MFSRARGLSKMRAGQEVKRENKILVGQSF